MNIRTRVVGGLLAVVMSFGMLAVPAQAKANEKGERLATYGLGAATVALLAHGKAGAALVAAAGTAIAAEQWQSSINRRHRCEFGGRRWQRGDRDRDDGHNRRDQDRW
jgi:hypothetical protein